jgi:lipopolysaccharide export system permease protein
MTLIDRYLFRQLLVPTVLALLALTAVAFLSQSLSALDLIVDQRQSLGVFLRVSALAMPELISLVLPVAVFVAAVIALNRLHTEHEIVVCFAGGMSRWNVVAPAIRLAAYAAVASLVLNLWVAPPASQAMRREIFRARADLAATLVKPGEFTEPAGGLTVYAQSVTPGGAIKNLFVHQQRPDGSTTFSARSGQIAEKDGRPMLIMRQGSSQQFNASGVLNFLQFDEYALDLSPFLAREDEVHFKTSDRWLHELAFPDLTQAWERRYRKKLLSEANSRIASPLYNLALMALALAAVLGGPFSRLGYAGRITWGASAAAAARILGFAVQGLAIKFVWLNLLQYLVPIVVTVLALRIIFRGRASAPAPSGSSPSDGRIAYAGAGA